VTLAQLSSGKVAGLVATVARANSSYKYLFFDSGDFAIGVPSALSAAGVHGLSIGGRELVPDGAAALKTTRVSLIN
jgi:hypothetical protein